MLSLCLLISLSATPRGLESKDPVDLVTQVEARLPKWLPGGPELTAQFATEKEVAAFFGSMKGVSPADAKRMAKSGAKDQMHERASVKTFAAVRALVVVRGRQTNLDLFDSSGTRCEVPLLTLDSGRMVLLMSPLTDTRSFESELESPGEQATTYLEKKDGSWAILPIPAPPPPDCAALLKKAAKAVYYAEKSYYAENDTYATSLEKIGVDATTLGEAKAKVLSADAKAFAAEVTLRDGVVRITDASGEVTVVKACSH